MILAQFLDRIDKDFWFYEDLALGDFVYFIGILFFF